jgi:hypothetical protein
MSVNKYTLAKSLKRSVGVQWSVFGEKGWEPYLLLQKGWQKRAGNNFSSDGKSIISHKLLSCRLAWCGSTLCVSYGSCPFGGLNLVSIQ